MTTSPDNKLLALQKSTQQKKSTTRLRVVLALEKMRYEDIPINFQSVAKHASVSKAWLYAQEDLVTSIKQLRMKSGKIEQTRDYLKQIHQKEDEITALKRRIEALSQENTALKQQVETIYGQLCEQDTFLKKRKIDKVVA